MAVSSFILQLATKLPQTFGLFSCTEAILRQFMAQPAPMAAQKKFHHGTGRSRLRGSTSCTSVPWLVVTYCNIFGFSVAQLQRWRFLPLLVLPPLPILLDLGHSPDPNVPRPASWRGAPPLPPAAPTPRGAPPRRLDRGRWARRRRCGPGSLPRWSRAQGH